jgi:hypothetical protein
VDGRELLANDTDIDGDILDLVTLSQPSNGVVTLNPDGSILFTPEPGFVGVDTFTYTITDSNGAEATGLVIVQVSDVEEQPEIGGPSGAATNSNNNDSAIIITPVAEALVEESADAAPAPASIAPLAGASNLLSSLDGELTAVTSLRQAILQPICTNWPQMS